MKTICILLIIIIILVSLIIIVINSFNRLNIINIKINNSEEKINKYLHKKYDLIGNLVKSVKKVIKKKDYLKEYNNIKIESINNYELDRILEDTHDLIMKLIEDNKELDTKANKDLLKELQSIDHKLIANKKYFNKNNNLLMKNLSGYNKVVANIFHIYVKNSYEIKEPTE